MSPLDVAEQSRVFWATVAQIAGVFAVPLVLEARRSVALWRNTRPAVRRLQAAVYFVAAILIIELELASLLTLMGAPEPSRGLHVVLLAATIAGLIAIPPTSYLLAANAVLVDIVTRAVPWSSWRAERRRWRRDESRLTTLMRDGIAAKGRAEDALQEMRDTEASGEGADAPAAGVPGIEPLIDAYSVTPEGSRELKAVYRRGTIGELQRAIQRQVGKNAAALGAIISHLEEVAAERELHRREVTKVTYISAERRLILESRTQRSIERAGDPATWTPDLDDIARQIRALTPPA